MCCSGFEEREKVKINSLFQKMSTIYELFIVEENENV